MFETMKRSWGFAKLSYSMIWEHKSLVIFPLLSGVATLMVFASFLAPLWGLGTLEHWMQLVENEQKPTTQDQVLMFGIMFAFYFATYFIMIFFNAALTACTMRVIQGEEPSVMEGLAAAGNRLPQILAWSFVSAIIGTLLRTIESINEKAGAIVASILGAAWSALTYFVVPVLVLDRVGPIEAFKRSAGTLKKTWGTALVGNFSLGILAVVIALPLILLSVAIGFYGVANQNIPVMVTAGVLLLGSLIGVALVSSAADVVFKTLLFQYATGKTLPAGIDTSAFDAAFKPKKKN
jgi:hypothetical protein